MQMMTNINVVWFISILMFAFKRALAGSLRKNGLPKYSRYILVDNETENISYKKLGLRSSAYLARAINQTDCYVAQSELNIYNFRIFKW